MGEKTENYIGFVFVRATLVSLYPFHMLKSETVVINQHIGGILRELKTSEPS